MMADDPCAVTVKLLGNEKPVVRRFRDISFNGERLYSEQTGEILRYMLGQLEIFHLRGEGRLQRTYPVTYPAEMIRRKRNGYDGRYGHRLGCRGVCQQYKASGRKDALCDPLS